MAFYATYLGRTNAIACLQISWISADALPTMVGGTFWGEHPIAPPEKMVDGEGMQLKNHIKSFGMSGAVIGGLLGLGFGYWCIYRPGLGSPMISGLVLGWGFTGISGALTVGGLSALMAGMYYFGVTKERILHSRAAIELTLGIVK